MQLNGKSLKPEWFSNIQQMRDEEIDFLYSCVEETEGNILEVGMGGSTFAFLDATKDTDREVWSIDLSNKLTGYYNVLPRDYYVRLNFFQEDSRTIELPPWEKFDILLIDGDHHFENVRQDTMNFCDNVTDGGIILYHDYNMVSVRKFVNSWCEDFAWLYKRQNNLVALKKL